MNSIIQYDHHGSRIQNCYLSRNISSMSYLDLLQHLSLPYFIYFRPKSILFLLSYLILSSPIHDSIYNRACKRNLDYQELIIFCILMIKRYRSQTIHYFSLLIFHFYFTLCLPGEYSVKNVLRKNHLNRTWNEQSYPS
jgi:hypothetical protein